jgi:xanthine/CO dehydrogenase XdhC/CoxF family maturation factor
VIIANASHWATILSAVKELTDILAALAELPGDIESAIATVVRVSGSAYRSPGARLLITGDGRIIGQVSGGCLERDVVRRAGGVIASGQPVLVRYETTDDPETGSKFVMGCGGTIDVLIEPVNSDSGRVLIGALKQSRSQRLVLATVISRRHPLAKLGERHVFAAAAGFEISELRFLEFADGSHGPEAHVTGKRGANVQRSTLNVQLSSEDAGMLRAMVEKARAVLVGDRSSVGEVETSAGPVEVFFDLLKPPTSLVIFGAGNDAVPLVAAGQLLGWAVTVVDLSSSPADAGRSWSPDRLVRCQVDQVGNHVSVGAETAVVVMTHNFNHDQKLLRWLAGQRVGYLGVLGPRHRTDQLLGELRIESLRAPVGLDIGAETPEEVAMSIAAEITAVLRGRDGVALSARPGPIHVRSG